VVDRLAPTQQEVRRAINWADKWIDSLYHTISYGGKEYAIMKFAPGLPITLKLTKPLPSVISPPAPDILHPGDCVRTDFIACTWGGRWWGFCDIETTTDTGESWSGVYKFFGWSYIPLAGGGTYVKNPVAELEVEYAPDPSDYRRMKAKITVKAWYPDDYTADLYFVRWDSAKNMYVSEVAISDLKNNIGAVIERSTEPFKPFPALTGIAGAYYGAAYYYWYSRPALRDRALKMLEYLDYFGYAYNTAEALFGDAGRLPDDVWCREDILYRHCKNFDNEPKSLINFINFFDEYCLCPRYFTGPCHCLTCFAIPGLWTGLPIAVPCDKCFPYTCEACHAGACGSEADWKGLVTQKAVFLMCKYGDPTKKDNSGNSAEDYLINGWTDTCGKTSDGIIKYWEKGRGLRATGGVYCTMWGYAIAAFSMLGYGFGYSEAKEVADDLAEIAVKTQWGYPFTPGEEGKGYWLAPDGTVKMINRPDLTGAFFQYFKWVDDKPVYEMFRLGFLESFKEKVLGWDLPPEWLVWCPMTLETTLPTVRALRIYDAYKFRMGS
jgi:hypothetical protein